MSTELRFPSNDKAADEKIKRLVGQAAHIRDCYSKIEKSRTASQIPEHPKSKTEAKREHRSRQTGEAK